jgi:hypothetical protein
MAKIKLIDAIELNRVTVNRVAYEMQCLADSFIDTGNKIVADKLGNWAQELIEVKETVRKAHSEDVFEMVKKAEQASKAVLDAALAGIKMASKVEGEG